MIITNLATRDLFEHERLFQSLTPEVVNNSLNAALLYNKETKETAILMKDSLAAIKMQLDCTVEEAEENLGIFFEFSKLMYILHNYTEEELANLKLKAEYDAEKESSKFVITCAADRLALPHMVMTESQRDDYLDLDFEHLQTGAGFNWTTLSDSQRLDFSSGLANALTFLDIDEKKNNAVAIYADKIVANDAKHVFVWKLPDPMQVQDWIPVHKKIVKIASSLMNSGLLSSFVVDESLALLSTSKAICKMNNAVSNIAPPNEDNLKEISSETLSLELEASGLYQTSKFFSGFYSTNSMNPLKIDFSKNEMTFILQDSGLADFGACNIERKIECDSKFEGEVTIINNSLNNYLSIMNSFFDKMPTVRIYAQSDKPAVKIANDQAEIYLARLK